MGMSLLVCRRRGNVRWVMLAVAAVATLALMAPAIVHAQTVNATHQGGLDCNGESLIQQSARRTAECTDIRGFDNEWNQNTWNGRFYDNGTYIGHDEPSITFLSHQPGSGNDVTFTETIPRDPSKLPTDANPGHDISHWFELSPAPWLGMAMCDSNSYPTNVPCAPESDANASTCVGTQTTNCFPGGGSAFMELQLYPPGFPPVNSGVGCDDSHWCAALTIDSLECTVGFAVCNPQCEEPVNWAFISTDGVPAGPPSPQDQDAATYIPDRHTMLLNPGDTISIHMFDASVPGQRGGHAFEVVIYDFNTHQVGWMQASAANGFMNTSSTDCSGTPYNFQPEYNTAAKQNIVPWAALATNITNEFETGHWESCQSITGPAVNTFLPPSIGDTYYNNCIGPYEDVADGDGPGTSEPSDSPCYPAGDTHGPLDTAPDLVTGCLDFFVQNGDLDFDGTPYYPEWPVGQNATDKLPGSFVDQLPTTGGRQYPAFFFQTDIALSESTCTGATATGCTVPPEGPGDFYPYWTRVSSFGGCAFEFGNVSAGRGVNDFGGDAEYGTDQIATLGYPEFEGPVMRNRCGGGFGPHSRS